MAANLVLNIVSNTTGLKKGFAEANGLMAKFGRVGNLALTGAAVGAVALAKNLAGVSEAIDKTLIKSTGAAGAELAALKQNVLDVGASVPQSMEQVASAVGEVSRFFGASGDGMEALSKTFLDFSRVAGTDVANSVSTVASILKAYGENQGPEHVKETLGDILRISMDTGIEAGKLQNQLGEFGQVFHNIGFNVEETAAIFGQLATAGVSVTRIGPGLNKFGRDMAKLGRDPLIALREVVGQVRNATATTEALTIATENFGAEGAQRLTAAIRAGAFDIETFNGLVGDGAVVLDSQAESMLTLGERMDIVKNQLTTALLPAAEQLVKVFSDFLIAVGEDGLAGALTGTLLPGIADLTGAAGVLRDVLTVIAAIKFAGMIAALGVAGPIAVGIAAIAASAALIYFHWDSITGAIDRANASLQQHLGIAQAVALVSGGQVAGAPPGLFGTFNVGGGQTGFLSSDGLAKTISRSLPASAYFPGTHATSPEAARAAREQSHRDAALPRNVGGYDPLLSTGLGSGSVNRNIGGYDPLLSTASGRQRGFRNTPSSPVNVNVLMPAGTTPNDVARNIEDYLGRGGSITGLGPGGF